jgi:hypothetical protein
LGHFCRAKGADFLPLALDNKEICIFGDDDRHWNAKAHGRVADEVMSFLSRRQRKQTGRHEASEKVAYAC